METKHQAPLPHGPRRARGHATRADIIAVAKRLFSQHGYHSTGLSDIQVATNLTKGAFYHHFKSKEDLALAVLESAQCDYAEHLIGPAMAQDSPGKRLMFMLDRALELNARPGWANCQMMATLCAELTTTDGRLREAVHTLQMRRLEVLTDLFRQAQASGEVSPQADPLVWAEWIHCTFTGLLLSRKLGAVCAAPTQVIAQIKSVLFSTSIDTGMRRLVAAPTDRGVKKP